MGDSPAEAARFSEAVSLEVLAHQDDPIGYLAQMLKRFSATRFHNKAAERLRLTLRSTGAGLRLSLSRARLALTSRL
jgi:hypothetical protein